MNRYVRVDRGAGSRAGQLLRHVSDSSRWQVRVFLHRDAKGKQVRISEVVIGKKRDAERRLIELLQGKSTNRLAPRTPVAMRQLARDWLREKTATESASPRSIAGYRRALDTYALPVIGHRRVTDLTLREVTKLYSDMRLGQLPSACREAGWRGQPLGARAVQIVHTSLSQMMKLAVRQGLITHNPLVDAVVPSSKPREKRFLTVAERRAFLAAADEFGAFYRVFYRALVDLGLRPGEACGLRWEDVDFANDRVTIQRAVTRGKNGERVLAMPKTSRSRRTIPLFGLADALLDHQAWQREVGLDAAGFVFTNQDGNMLAPWALNTRELHRVAERAGITGLNWYSFRHSFGSLHLSSGTPLAAVSKWMGHSSVRMTADVYMHLDADAGMDWAARHVAWLAREEAANATQATVN